MTEGSPAPDWFDRESRAGFGVAMLGRPLLLAGGGALGGALANLLSMWGFGEATVVDPDVYEPSNAARTLDFPWRQVATGRPLSKARELARHWRRRVLPRNPDAHVVAVHGYLQELPGVTWQSAAAVLGAVDHPCARHHLALLARRYGRALISGGFDGASGQWSVWFAGPLAAACPSCALQDEPLMPTADTSCSGAGLRATALQRLAATPTLATTVASVMADALTAWLSGQIPATAAWQVRGQLRGLWRAEAAPPGAVTRFDLGANPACPHHDQPAAPPSLTLRGRTLGVLLADLERQRPGAALALLAPLVVRTVDDGGTMVRVDAPAWRVPRQLPPATLDACLPGQPPLALRRLDLRLVQACRLGGMPAARIGLGAGCVARLVDGDVVRVSAGTSRSG